MTRICLSFLSGSISTSLAIYLAGGTSKSIFLLGLFIGLILIFIPLLLWMKPVSRFLWATASAWEDFRASYSSHHKRGLKPELQEIIDEPTKMERDLTSALMNMGEKKPGAVMRARQAITQSPDGDFDSLMRIAFKRVA